MIGALHTMANSEDTAIKTYEFKLRLNKSFVEACEREVEHSRQIYNAAEKREREGRTQSEPPQRCRLSATAANAKPNE
jgi:hypothetical protein